MQYESSSRTTLDERIAWNAAFDPCSQQTSSAHVNERLRG